MVTEDAVDWSPPEQERVPVGGKDVDISDQSGGSVLPGVREECLCVRWRRWGNGQVWCVQGVLWSKEARGGSIGGV